MKFMYLITKNCKLMAGFTNYIDACLYKDFLTNISHMAGYKDKFQIIDMHNK